MLSSDRQVYTLSWQNTLTYMMLHHSRQHDRLLFTRCAESIDRLIDCPMTMDVFCSHCELPTKMAYQLDPYRSSFRCKAKDCGMYCTKPITTKQQSVVWTVSQSRHAYVGRLTWQLPVVISCGSQWHPVTVTSGSTFTQQTDDHWQTNAAFTLGRHAGCMKAACILQEACMQGACVSSVNPA